MQKLALGYLDADIGTSGVAVSAIQEVSNVAPVRQLA